jgi:hypothetical protein
MVVYDPPFGLRLADWDDCIVSEDDLKSLKCALELANNNEKGTVFISYGPLQHHLNMQKIFGAQSGYSDFHHCYVYKFDNDARGTKCYIHAVEQLSVMYSGGRTNCTMTLDKDPRKRHNLLFAKANHGRLRFEEGGAKVNETEKPASTTFQLAKAHSRPGGNVLILGGGAGGDAEGALFAGMNVFVLERDPKQFSAMVKRFTTLANKWDALANIFEHGIHCLQAIGPAVQMAEKQTNLAEEFKDFLACRKQALAEPKKSESKKAKPADAKPLELCPECQGAIGKDPVVCLACEAQVHIACAMKCAAKVHVVCSAECGANCCNNPVPETQEEAMDAAK